MTTPITVDEALLDEIEQKAKAARYHYDADAVREPHSRQWDNDIKPVGTRDGHGDWGQSGGSKPSAAC